MRLLLTVAAIALAVPLSAGASAATKPAATKSAATKAAAAVPVAAPKLDADAAAALDGMGAYLRTLGRFQVRADGTFERVYEGGQKLQFAQMTTYDVEKPDHMIADVTTGERTFRVFYDGSQMTLVAPRISKYTSFPVTGTLSDVLVRARDDFGIDFPLQDLFRWGSESAVATRPTSGFRVGAGRINGTPVGHYAFQQPGVDFQIWITEGAKPLPLKLVITNRDDAAQPQYSANFTWDLAPAPVAFTFKPQPGDSAIDLRAAAAAASTK